MNCPKYKAMACDIYSSSSKCQFIAVKLQDWMIGRFEDLNSLMNNFVSAEAVLFTSATDLNPD